MTAWNPVKFFGLGRFPGGGLPGLSPFQAMTEIPALNRVVKPG